ncbi:MAG: glycine--tRNA ligase subunit beta [candidate division WOR-3 bacterium]
MMTNKIFFEMGFEELPFSALKKIEKDFPNKLKEFLISKGIKDFQLKLYLTPRRLAFFIENIPEKTEKNVKLLKGPQERLFYKDNQITELGKGFLNSRNLKETDIQIKDGYIWYKKEEEGVEVWKIFSENIFDIIDSLEFEKRMRWDDSKITFPRPIRWVTSFFNNQQLEIKIGNLTSSNFTFGNRNTGNIKIPVFNGDDWLEKVRENYVEPSYIKRREMILEGINDIIKNENMVLTEDEELLDEVSYLVEYPVVFRGEFEKEFLKLPKEIIIAALKQHQRYFTLQTKDGNLSNYFIFISNSPFAQTDDIVNNNQRIIRSRLEDAQFYFNNDISRSMEDYEKRLKETLFCEGLGSFYDKVERDVEISKYLIDLLGFNDLKGIDLKQIGIISKFDITTDMIKDGKEFTKLQGIIGYYYARLKGFKDELARISYEHYMPITVLDKNPTAKLGKIFSIADKVDNITSAFVSGNKPTGSKDIMYVRRDTLSLISFLVTDNISISLYKLFKLSTSLLKGEQFFDEIISYIKKRIEIFFKDYYNIDYDISRSFLQNENIDPYDIKIRSEKVLSLKNDENFRIMVEGQKRVTNILKGLEKIQITDFDFDNDYEKKLYENGKSVLERNKALFEKKDYDAILNNLLSLRDPIDKFFDNVLVNDNDEKKRKRRLSLLFFIREIFLEFSDLSYIVFEQVEQKKDDL